MLKASEKGCGNHLQENINEFEFNVLEEQDETIFG